MNARVAHMLCAEPCAQNLVCRTIGVGLSAHDGVGARGSSFD